MVSRHAPPTWPLRGEDRRRRLILARLARFSTADAIVFEPPVSFIGISQLLVIKRQLDQVLADLRDKQSEVCVRRGGGLNLSVTDQTESRTLRPPVKGR